MPSSVSPPRSTGAKRDRAAGRRVRATAPLPDLSQYGRLAEYNRKRHFGMTPEPAGTMAPRQAGHPLQFVVQKHRASHLHYDVRLEHRGVMLSWAVPKGPSRDPAVKRLAMETEAHPMDYNQFEGVIPEGEYGGGVVMIWDTGIWAPIAATGLGDEAEADRQLAKGDLKFALLGEKLIGSWVLVRTRGMRQWLLIKHQDAHASREDVTMAKPLSVVSGRTMSEIALAAGASPRQLQQALAVDAEPLGAAAAERAGPAKQDGEDAEAHAPAHRAAARTRARQKGATPRTV
jgi:bifunctional non-homologous end joining protein LigD